MGLVSGFVEAIVEPLQTAAGQIRQLSTAHDEANSRLQGLAQALTTSSFRGNGANAFLLMVEKQSDFVSGITEALDVAANFCAETATVMEDAAEIADMALGGPLIDLAESVLTKLTPNSVLRRGASAVSDIVNDIRRTCQDFFRRNGTLLDDVLHARFRAALSDAGFALGDLAHLAGDLFALLDAVETILGHWAGEVMLASNGLSNKLEGAFLFVADKILGLSELEDNSAILIDPNSTNVEKGLAAIEIGVAVAGDVLLFIPGAEEGRLAAEGATEGEELAVQGNTGSDC